MANEAENYKDCMRYFKRCIKNVIEKGDALKETLKETLGEQKSAYAEIAKKSGALYGNNVFGFALLAALILLPFAVIAVLIRLAGGSAFVSLLPVIVGLLLLAVWGVFRLRKCLQARRQYSALCKAAADAEQYLFEQNSLLKTLQKTKKRLKKFYNTLKEKPSMSEEEIEDLRRQFDDVYEEIQTFVEE